MDRVLREQNSNNVLLIFYRSFPAQCLEVKLAVIQFFLFLLKKKQLSVALTFYGVKFIPPFCLSTVILIVSKVGGRPLTERGGQIVLN